MEKQIDEMLTKNYDLYKNGIMSRENFYNLLDTLCFGFGTEYIANRMIACGIQEKL